MGHKGLDPKVADAEFTRNGLEPLEPYVSSNTPRRCKCLTCGRLLTTQHRHMRVAKGIGCRYCLGLKIDTAQAIQRMRDNGFEPIEPYPGSTSRWKVRCATTGQVVRPTLARVSQTGHSCSACKAVLMSAPRFNGRPAT